MLLTAAANGDQLAYAELCRRGSESVDGVFLYLGVFDLPKGLYPAGRVMYGDMAVGDRLLLIPKGKKRGAGIVEKRATVEIA